MVLLIYVWNSLVNRRKIPREIVMTNGSGRYILHIEKGSLEASKSSNPVFFLFTQKVKELYHQYQSKFYAFFSCIIKKMF